MNQVSLEGPDLGRCDCGVHYKGRCDTDFPLRTHGLPYTPRQIELMTAARAKLGIVSVTPAEVSVTDTLSVTVPCHQCGVMFEPKRATAKYCSPACRVKHGRE